MVCQSHVDNWRCHEIILLCLKPVPDRDEDQLVTNLRMKLAGLLKNLRDGAEGVIQEN